MFFSFASEFQCFILECGAKSCLMTECCTLFTEMLHVLKELFHTHMPHSLSGNVILSIYIYICIIHTHSIVYIKGCWFEIVIAFACIKRTLGSFPRDAALFVWYSTRSHNILFKEYHALWTPTMVHKSDIIHKRVLVEMGLKPFTYSNALPALFCMLANVQATPPQVLLRLRYLAGVLKTGASAVPHDTTKHVIRIALVLQVWLW